MQRAVVTGAGGFIGRNLCLALSRREGLEVRGFDLHDPREALRVALASADLVFHLAGVNRSQDPAEFETGNAGFTAQLCRWLAEAGARPAVVFTSSSQVELGNAYGQSKLAAEAALVQWSESGGGPVAIFRPPNVFGKWARPNYNSAVATFCHNIAHGLPIRIDDPASTVRLVYVDDLIAAFIAALDEPPTGVEHRVVTPVTEMSVGELAERVEALHAAQHSPDLPDLAEPFARALYATYLSYLEPEDLTFGFVRHRDDRGYLAELVRQPHAGQIFVSHTRPGITRGNHYHDTKIERFMVVGGEGVVRLRGVGTSEVRSYAVSGESPQAVVIPPGMTHSIENVGADDMITLFWADEIFDPDHPDTQHERVLQDREQP